MIIYFYSNGSIATQIKKELDSTLVDSSPLNTMVKRWVSEFGMGRTSTSDEPRSERSNAQNNIPKAQNNRPWVKRVLLERKMW